MQLADFDSMMDNAPGDFEQPGSQPAQQSRVEPEPIEEVGELAEQVAKGEEDLDDLLEDEPAPAATAITEAADKWRALEDSADLPDDLMSKLVTAKNGDREWQVTVEEAIKGYQRTNESTRRSQELDGREERIQQSEQRMRGFFESIKDPNNLIEVMDRQLGPQVLDQALAIRQAQRDEDISMIEAAGIATMRRFNVDKTDPRVREAMLNTKKRLERERTADIEARKLQARNRELESGRQAEDQTKRVQEMQATYRKQLEQLVPTAFKAARIRDSAKNRDAHIDHLKVLMRRANTATITRDLVAQAARAVREDLEDARAEEVANKSKLTATKQQPRAAKGAGGGVAPTRGHVASTPKKMSDFDDHFGNA
jgi:hypothetical protein